MVDRGAKVLAIAATNLKRFARDRSNVFFVFILPLGLVFLIGAQFGGGFLPEIGVVAPSSATAQAMVEDLEANDTITVVRYQSEADLLAAVEDGTVAAGMVVPADLDTSLGDGTQAQIGFIARSDGFGPQLQSLVAGVVTQTSAPIDVARFVGAQGVAPATAETLAAAALSDGPSIAVAVETTGEELFPSDLDQFSVGAATQLVLFMFLTGLAGSAAVIQTRHLGVATRMLGTPTSAATIVAGEALGRFVIVLTQGLYIVVATVLIFGVDWGPPLAAGAIVVVFAAVGAGAALLFGTLFANDQQAGGFGVMVGLGLAAIGGSMLPVELFSDSMRTVSQFTPHFWANDAFAELTRRDGTFTDIAGQLVVLSSFAIVLLVLASWRMRIVLTRR